MAKLKGSDCRLYVGGFDLNAGVTDVNLEIALKALDATGLNDTGRRKFADTREDHLDHSGLYNDASNEVNTLLTTQLAAKKVILFSFGDSLSSPCVMGGSELVTDYSRQAKIGSMVMAKGGYASDLEWEIKGKLALPKTTMSTFPFNHTIIDDGASSSAGAVGVLQVISMAGGTNVTIEIMHSNDNFVANTVSLITFTAVTTSAGRGSERLSVAGAVSQYIRVKATQTGGVTSVVAVVGFQRG